MATKNPYTDWASDGAAQPTNKKSAYTDWATPASTPTKKNASAFTDWTTSGPKTPEQVKAEFQAAVGGHHTLFDNLGDDLKNTIVGSGIGVAHVAKDLVTHPLQLDQRIHKGAPGYARQVVKQEKDQWGPLVSGGKNAVLAHYYQATNQDEKAKKAVAESDSSLASFWHGFHQHPLNPLLDVLALVTGGAARAGALRTLPEAATAREIGSAALLGRYQGPLRTLEARSHDQGGLVTTKTLPRGTGRVRIQAQNKAAKLLTGSDWAHVGEYAQAGKALKNAALPTELKHRVSTAYQDFATAGTRVNRHERVAAWLVNALPLEKDLAAWEDHLHEVGMTAKTKAERDAADHTLQIINHPKVQALYHEPNTAVTRFLDAGRALADAGEEIKIRTGATTAENLMAAPFRHMRSARGAEFVPHTDARLGKVSPKLAEQRAYVERLQGLHDRAVERTTKNAEATALPDEAVIGSKIVGDNKAITAPGGVKAERLGAALSVAKDKLESMETAAAKRIQPTGLVGGGDPTDLTAEIQEAGRPVPFYLPDAPRKTRGQKFRSVGANPLNDPQLKVKESQAALFRAGTLAMDPGLLSQSFLRDAIHDYRHDLHGRIVDVAKPIGADEHIPDGYEFVQELPGQRPSHMKQTLGEHNAVTEKEFKLTGRDVPDEEIARDAEGRRLVVPESFAKAVQSEAREATNMAARLLKFPFDVWRALILHLRVPWLENNIVGNHLMAALRFAGPEGIQAYAGAIGEVRGVKALRQALDMPETKRHLTAEDMRELLPAQTKAGTFLGSQSPGSSRRGKQAMNVLSGGLAPVDKASEGFLRRAGAETALRRDPLVRKRVKQMPKETRSLRTAMRQELSSNPDMTRLVDKQVNDALGDYLHMGAAERKYIRSVIPFYAWYREIVKITGRLPLDQPGTTAIIAKLSQIEAERNQDQTGPLPGYLQGALKIPDRGDGTEGLLNLHGANPYTSVTDLAKAAQFLTGQGNQQEAAYQFAGLLNPFLGSGQSSLADAQAGNGGHGVLADTALDVLLNLPQVRVLTNPPSKLYPTRTRADLIKQLLGDPRRYIDPAVAAQQAAEGR